MQRTISIRIADEVIALAGEAAARERRGVREEIGLLVERHYLKGPPSGADEERRKAPEAGR